MARVMSGFPATARAARAKNIVQVVGSGESYTVYRDCGTLASNQSLSELLPPTVASLNFVAVDQCDHFAVHSGVARWNDGVVALPAESGHGKTTLTASLVKAGFEYLSDEALVFEDDGTIVPYPKPLALSEWSADVLDVGTAGAETLVTAGDLGGEVGDGGPLTDLILSEYGHGEAKLESLPRSEAVASLIRLSFNHFKDPERAFRIATSVAREIRVWSLRYDDPIEAAALISDSLRD